MPVGELRPDQFFTGPDDPRFPLSRKERADPACRLAAFEAHVARWTVVEDCALCGRGLVPEEVLAHRHSHLGSRARVLARMFDDLSDEAKAEVRAYVAE